MKRSKNHTRSVVSEKIAKNESWNLNDPYNSTHTPCKVFNAGHIVSIIRFLSGSGDSTESSDSRITNEELSNSMPAGAHTHFFNVIAVMSEIKGKR